MKQGLNDLDSTLLVRYCGVCHMNASFSQSVIKIWLKVFMASTNRHDYSSMIATMFVNKERKILQNHNFTKIVQEEEG